MNYMNRMKNGLILGAIYDAVGYVFEFDQNPSHNIVDECVVDVINGHRPKLNFSDDTQMTMFIMEHLYSDDNFSDRGIFDKLTRAYIAWYRTQESSLPAEDATGIAAHNAMYARRAPGLTCLDSIKYIIKNSKIPTNNSMGCGSVMRILPFVGLIDKIGFEKASDMAVMSGYMTHSHEKNEEAIRLYMSIANYAMTGKPDVRMRAFYNKIRDIKNITELGEGWTALECVEMGAWAAMNYNSADAIVVSTAHPGDSDSTGMIAGTLLGVSIDNDISTTGLLDKILVQEEIEVITELLNSL